MLTLRNTKGSPLTYTEMDNNLTYLESLTGDVPGTNYIVVKGTGTPTENGTELETAYATAKTMSPAADNRITVVVFPGEYGLSEKLVLDTAFIDLVSVTGNRDVILDRADVIGDPFEFAPPSTLVTSDALLIDADNVYVKGMVGKLRNSPNFMMMIGTSDYILPLQVGDNLPNVVVENCNGGLASFSSTPLNITSKEINGTYINVETNSGFVGNVSGTFTDCVDIGVTGSFGAGGIASGIFTNCIGGDGSFGGSAGGVGGTADGTFTNCIGGDGSFGGASGTLTGKLYSCRLTIGTFPTVTSGGRTYFCIDGNGDANNQ